MKRIVSYNGDLKEVNGIKEGLKFVEDQYKLGRAAQEHMTRYCFIYNQFGKPVVFQCFAVNSKGKFIRKPQSDFIDECK